MRKILLVTILLLLLIRDVNAQEKIYLPIIFQEKENMTCEYPILAIASDSGETINLLDEGSGLQLADPYWQPATSDTSPTYVNPQTTDGSSLIHTKYNNVVETIPIRITGEQGHVTIRNLRRAFNLSVNAQGYWTQIFEQDKVWLEILPKGDNFLTAYSTIYEIRIVGLSSPFTSPFANPIDKSQFDTISIVITREPFTSPLKPGEIIGPLYNLIKNPDFELWNFGVGDSQPDSWDDLQTVSIVGTNNRYQTNPKWGNNAIKVSVTGSTAIGEAKGVTQVIDDTQNNTTYTILAWVKNDGISNGVGRILVNYSNQLELYRDDSIHGWQLYSGTITTGVDDTVSINLQILSTANNTLGDIFFDGLMFVEGDWTDEAADNLIPYMTSSHVVNHQDVPINTIVNPGDINFVDVWNIPGDVDSKIRLEFQNNTTPADSTNPIEIYDKIRIGMRRTGNVFNFTNYIDPIGKIDTTASSDNRIDVTGLSVNQTVAISIDIVNNLEDNEGRFKVIARIYDEKTSGDSTLQGTLRYFIGTSGINEQVLPTALVNTLNSWTILDLTESQLLNFDRKFASSTTNQLGYLLQMNRSTGSEDARLDYVMLIPTDGGYIEITLDPALPYKNAVTTDNTQNKTNVERTNIVNGFGEVFETPANQNSLFSFNNILWIGTGNGELYSFQNNVGTLRHTYGNAINSMESYNGKLYITDGRRIYSTDGNTFPGTEEFQTLDASTGVGLKSFNSKLYVGTASGNIYEWDGSSVSLSFATGEVIVYSFDIYGGQLYASTGADPKVYVYDSVSDSWSLSFTSPTGTIIYTLKTFKNELYAGTNGGTIYKFDNANWIEVTDFTGLLGTVGDLEELNGNLYATGGQVNENVAFTTDGTNWNLIYDTQELVGWQLANYQGELFVSTFSSPATLYKIVFENSSYDVTEYNGGGFSAPPRTLQSDSRHRYFFSYDRENFVNNIDDKALIGIGYRPRFFSIINKDSF